LDGRDEQEKKPVDGMLRRQAPGNKRWNVCGDQWGMNWSIAVLERNDEQEKKLVFRRLPQAGGADRRAKHGGTAWTTSIQIPWPYFLGN
jgi:hypothetical protein